MRAITKLLAAAATSLAIGAVAVPASAATIIFATYHTSTANLNKTNMEFKNGNSSNTSKNGSLFTTAPNGSTHAATPVLFSFAAGFGLDSFDDLPALFDLTGSVTNNPATFDSDTKLWAETKIDGSFDFIFNGTTGDYDGHHLVKGSTVLLHGGFTDGWITGAGNDGTFDVTVGNGGHVTYTSNYWDFSNAVPNTNGLTLHMAGGPIVANNGKALKTFKAHTGGDFQYDAVPEPGAWALMILGLGGAGAMLRRRRVSVAA